MLLRKPDRWTTHPEIAVELDPSHPLVSRLVRAILINPAMGLRDVVNGVNGQLNSATNYTGILPAINGSGATINGTGAIIYWPSIVQDIRYKKSTVVAGSRITTTGGYQNGWSASHSGWYQTTLTGYLESGQRRMRSYVDSTDQTVAMGSYSSPEEYHCALTFVEAGEWGSTPNKVYFNGSYKGAFTATTPSYGFSGAIYIGCAANDESEAYSSSGTHRYCYVFDGELPAEAIWQLYKEPYGLWKKTTARTYSFPSASLPQPEYSKLKRVRLATRQPQQPGYIDKNIGFGRNLIFAKAGPYQSANVRLPDRDIPFERAARSSGLPGKAVYFSTNSWAEMEGYVYQPTASYLLRGSTLLAVVSFPSFPASGTNRFATAFVDTASAVSRSCLGIYGSDSPGVRYYSVRTGGNLASTGIVSPNLHLEPYIVLLGTTYTYDSTYWIHRVYYRSASGLVSTNYDAPSWGSTTVSTNSVSYGGVYNTSTSEGWLGNIYLAAAWQRGMSPQEAQLLLQNPWRIFTQYNEIHIPQTHIDIYWQYSYATSDYVDGNWYNENNSQTNLYASINEPAPINSTYIWTASTGSPVTFDYLPMADPGRHDYHTYDYRLQGDGSTDCQITMYCGGTQIAQWTETSVPIGWTDYRHTISDAEAANITDYTQIRFKFDAIIP